MGKGKGGIEGLSVLNASHGLGHPMTVRRYGFNALGAKVGRDVQRNPGIDLARSVAIFSVIAAHTLGFSPGVFGVQIFFAISGYLLAGYTHEFTSQKFLVHRFLRLGPLAILMSLIFYFRFSTGYDFLANILLIQVLFANMASFPGGWSISSE